MVGLLPASPPRSPQPGSRPRSTLFSAASRPHGPILVAHPHADRARTSGLRLVKSFDEIGRRACKGWIPAISMERLVPAADRT
jgi:hypothetical protein